MVRSRRIQRGHRAPQRVPQRAPSPRLELQLHRFLGGQRRPTAMWDIGHEPHTARRLTSRTSVERVTPQFLDQPATEPRVKRMRIVLENHPWDINIHVPPRAPVKYITIGMVLGAIHGVFQAPLVPEEWREHCPADKRKIYKTMCTRLAKSRPSMITDGQVCRIDCALDRTVFLGLRPGGPNPDEWVLSLGPQRVETFD